MFKMWSSLLTQKAYMQAAPPEAEDEDENHEKVTLRQDF